MEEKKSKMAQRDKNANRKQLDYENNADHWGEMKTAESNAPPRQHQQQELNHRRQARKEHIPNRPDFSGMAKSAISPEKKRTHAPNQDQ